MSITGPIVNYFYSPVVRPAVERPLSLLANFVREQFRINGGGVLFDTAFNITRSSSKYVWGTGVDTGKLVEVPPNTPAYQHDPVTGAPLGLSVEGSATNLLTYSSQFDDASWSKTGGGTGSAPVVTPNSVVAPDGTTTADSVVFDVGAGTTGSDSSQLFKVESLTAADYNHSLWLKGASGGERVQLRTPSGGYEYITLTTEWQRFDRTATGSTSSVARAGVSVRQGLGETLPQVQTVHIWGAQLEQGTKPTSYIPTVATTLTRDADIVTSDAATFGDWFSSSEGTFVVEYQSSVDCVPLDINDGTTSNRIFIRQNTLSSFDVVSVSGGTQTTLSFSTTTTEGELLRFEFSYNGSNFTASFKGSTATQPASAPVGVTNAKLGCNIVNTKHVNGTIKLLTFQPEATL